MIEPCLMCHPTPLNEAKSPDLPASRSHIPEVTIASSYAMGRDGGAGSSGAAIVMQVPAAHCAGAGGGSSLMKECPPMAITHDHPRIASTDGDGSGRNDRIRVKPLPDQTLGLSPTDRTG